MKYFKIYHQNCKVAKAYIEMSEEDFATEVHGLTSDRVPVINGEDGLVDWDAMDIEMDRIYEEIEAEARLGGYNAGDYTIYIRRDDADMYDIERETR